VIRAARADDYDVFATLVRELGIDDPVPSEERFASHVVPRMLVYTRSRQVIGYVTYEKLVEAVSAGSVRVNVAPCPSPAPCMDFICGGFHWRP
jgi:hypothetical protein